MSAIELIIDGRKKDLGGFTVARVLPYAKKRMIGPFVFFDEMGPATFAPGKGIDVRPHPHIGLATVTYLFDGEMDHADSLGVHQTIRPGDVNWMTAGRGIVHSERTGAEARAAGFFMHGIQTWVALPQADEEIEPEFHHHGESELPRFNEGGAEMRLILGTGYGHAAPVKVFSPIIYIHAEAPAGARFALPDEHDELGVYLVSGALEIAGETLQPGQLAAIDPNAEAEVFALEDSRMMILGGASLGARFIEWNFVSSSQARIEQAKTDWRASAKQGWLDTPFTLPPGEHEHIPLPGDPDPG
ncbi:MAG: pirin family protein [Pseudomonadota bacterium]